jgi:cell division protein FtsB
MNVDLGIWTRLTRAVVFLFAVAFVFCVAVWYRPQIQKNERMRREILRLDTEIQKEEENHREVKAAVDALRFDPKVVERLAREKLRYSKPGETVIVFEDVAVPPAGK